MRVCPTCCDVALDNREVVDGLRIHGCRSCGLLLSSITRDERVTSEFSLVDETAYHNSVGRSRRRQAAEILSFLRPHVRGDERILDIGCSFGYFLREAQDAGFSVAGIEPDAVAQARACSLLGDGVVERGTLQEAYGRDLSADVVATLDVLEHIPPDEHEYFAHLVRQTLTPQGLWVIKVPTTEGLYYRIADILVRVAPRLGGPVVKRLWQTDYHYPHTVYFDRRSLATWLNRHGFDVVDLHYLPEVPKGTAIDRLTIDSGIPRSQAYLMAPAMYLVNLVEAVRGRSDALLLLARPQARPASHPSVPAK